MSELKLHEEILLLALDDEKGTAQFGSMYPYALAGAILTELVLRRRIELAAAKPKKSPMIDAVDASPTGDVTLDSVLERIAGAKRRGSMQTWVGRIAQTKLTKQIAEGLAERGILRREEGRVLLFFRRDTWPENDPAPERRIIERLRAAVEGEGPVDGPTATLIALAKPVDLLKTHLGRDVVKQRKRRIEDIVSGNLAGDATRASIEAATAAMIATTAAVTAATTAATTSSC